jgi:hypothetical protein
MCFGLLNLGWQVERNDTFLGKAALTPTGHWCMSQSSGADKRVAALWFMLSAEGQRPHNALTHSHTLRTHDGRDAT